MTVTADLDATVERAWQLWADPRQFERWWGPPGYPATVVDHDLRAGGRITFFMTGTEGERHDSTWEVIAADPPRHLELRDADVDDDGRPNDGNAMTAMVITIDERDGGGAVMAIRTHFDSQAGMEQVLAMGIEEGMRMVLVADRRGPRRHACVKGCRVDGALGGSCLKFLGWHRAHDDPVRGAGRSLPGCHGGRRRRSGVSRGRVLGCGGRSCGRGGGHGGRAGQHQPAGL